MLTALIVCGTLIYLVLRAEKFGDRLLKLREEDHQAKTAQPKDSAPLPSFLWQWANSESEPWARGDKMKLLEESYKQVGDWKKVANSVGVASAND